VVRPLAYVLMLICQQCMHQMGLCKGYTQAVTQASTNGSLAVDVPLQLLNRAFLAASTWPAGSL
jgi:hypothetical protein